MATSSDPTGAARRWPICIARRSATAEAAATRDVARGWRRHRLGVEALTALLDRFDGGQIPVIPLKGPLLAESLYDEPGARPFTDLDLLVRRADVPRAAQLLGDLGYRALEWERPLAYELAHAAAAVFVPAPDGLPVDLHWELVGFVAGIRPRGLEIGEVWGRAVTSQVWGRPVLRLAPEDLLLYLAVHLAVHHPFERLAWQRDVALFIRRHGHELAWSVVVERARQWGVAGGVYLALSRDGHRGAAGVPPPVLAALRPRGLRGALLERLGGRAGDRWLEHLAGLLVLDRLADLGRGVAAAVSPSPAWVRSRYGTASALQGYRAHYGRLGRALSGGRRLGR